MPVLLVSLMVAVGFELPRPVEFAANRCQFGAALRILDHAGEQYPPRERDLLHAQLLLQLERVDEALPLLGRWTEEGTEHERAEVHFLRGLAHAGKARSDEAERDFRQAERRGFDAGLLLGARGMAQLAAGRLDEAEQTLWRAVELDPQLTGAAYNLACLYAKQGRIGPAMMFLRGSWNDGLRNPYKLLSDPWLDPIRQKMPGFVEAVIETADPSCGTW